MKQRLTYLLDNVSSFDPKQLRVRQDSFAAIGLRGAKEQHLTFRLDELPPEIWRCLRQCHELHIRWASSEPYEAKPPFSSRISPGLHAFFTPQRDRKADLLCPMLRKMFDSRLHCQSPEKSFVGAPMLSERFSMSSAFSYYQILPSLVDFKTYLSQNVCGRSSHGNKCQDIVDEILHVDYIDIDFDAISNTITVKAHWSQPTLPSGWAETAQRVGGMGPLEVGVLNLEQSDGDEPDSLKLGGFLTVVGEDTEPKPTLFSFPARFHPLERLTSPSTYSIAMDRPTGLHPTLRITLPSPPVSPSTERTCALHAYLTIPAHLFIDRYQFSDPLFLSSNRLSALQSLSGAIDLEAPAWIIDQWGSVALFELSRPRTSDLSKTEWNVTIPLHLRYLAPTTNRSGLAPIQVPWPVLFWACEADEGLKFPTSPFDRVNLGYDGLFGPKTMFYHLAPSMPKHNTDRAVRSSWEGHGFVETVAVPTMDLDSHWTPWLEKGTLCAVVLGLLWVIWCLLPSPLRRSSINRNLSKKKTG